MLFSVTPLALDDLDGIHAYVEDIEDDDTADRVIDDSMMLSKKSPPAPVWDTGDRTLRTMMSSSGQP
jgi:hypothetical protein